MANATAVILFDAGTGGCGALDGSACVERVRSVTEAASVARARAALAVVVKGLPPDDAISAVGYLREQLPVTAIVVLTRHATAEAGARAVRAGAQFYGQAKMKGIVRVISAAIRGAQARVEMLPVCAARGRRRH